MLQFQSADVRPIVEPNQSPLMDPINLSHPHLNYPLQLGCVPCSGKWSRRNISGAVFTSSLIVPVSPLIDFHYFLVIAASQEARRIAANDFSRPPRTGSLLQHHYQHHHCHRPIAFNFFKCSTATVPKIRILSKKTRPLNSANPNGPVQKI